MLSLAANNFLTFQNKFTLIGKLIAQWRFLSWWLEGPGPADLLTAQAISAAADRATAADSAQSQILLHARRRRRRFPQLQPICCCEFAATTIAAAAAKQTAADLQ